MRSLLFAFLALALAGCPRPLPDTPAAADLAALEARLVQEPTVAFHVSLVARGEPDQDVAFRLGPGQRVEFTIDDGPVLPVIESGDRTRARVVRYLLRRGAADLIATLTRTNGATPRDFPREVSGLGTGGWESIDGGQARGLLFPADGAQTFLWLNDETGLPMRRQHERLRPSNLPMPPVEIYSGWTFGS